MPILNSGTTNLTSLVIPDLYINLIAPTTVSLNGVPSNLAAFVGTASWGPLNTPVSGSSYSDFTRAFGTLNNRKYDLGTHILIGNQQGMNNWEAVRVSDGTDTAASAVLGSTQLTLTAKYTGSFGNSISVTVGAGSKANSYRFVIAAPGFTSETFDNIVSTPTTTTAVTSGSTTTTAVVLASANTNIVVGMAVSGSNNLAANTTVASVQDSTHITLSAAPTSSIPNTTTLTFSASNNSLWVAAANAISNGQNSIRPASAFVTATAGSATTVPTLATTTLSGGTDGIGTITASTLVGTPSPVVGMYAFSGTGFAILDVCDADDPTLWTVIDSFALAESGYAIQTAPAGNTVAQTVTAKQSAGLDSINTKLLHGDWVYWADPVSQVTRLVSPQPFSAGRLANLQPNLTGLNKKLYGIVGSQKTGVIGSTGATYATNELNTLVTNGIELLTPKGAGGIPIWTMRFGHNSSSNPTVHLDSYTTLTNYIAKTMNAGMGFYIGRTIDVQLFNDVTSTLNQFSATLQGAGLIGKADGSVPYSVLCNSSNNSPATIQQGIVYAAVTMSYLGIVEKFIVNLQTGTELSVSTHVVSNNS